MAKVLVRNLTLYQNLYQDPKSGLAWIEDGLTGLYHSVHANIHRTGSVTGMKKLGYWNKKDRIVRTNGYIYNIDTFVIDSAMDGVVADYCMCEACRSRRSKDGRRKRKNNPV